MVHAAAERPFRHLPHGDKRTDPKAMGFFGFGRQGTWSPNVNLYENDTAYLVCVDLAGVNKEEIDVVVEDQTLRIRGARTVPAPDEAADPQQRRVRIHLMEIDHGGFSRDVELPANVEKDQISATHRNGMLWIELPKKR